MNRQRQFFLAVILASVTMVIACGGGGNRKGGGSAPKADDVASLQQRKEAADLAAAEKAEARARARAKAEEEADAKNEANLEAYEAEIERLKEIHEKQMEKFKADDEAYKKALLVYQAAKAEFYATRELSLARGFYNDKEMEIAQRRFREIIKRYPNTQSAKDANTLLNNGFAAPRKTPAEPVPPVAPEEPSLILPPLPAPVAVVYPPDPDEIVPSSPISKPAPVLTRSRIPDGDFKPARTGEYQIPFAQGSGKTVYVRGYYRNGTYVQPHMRSAPGSGSKTGNSGKRK